jgi:hypothetical protein
MLKSKKRTFSSIRVSRASASERRIEIRTYNQQSFFVLPFCNFVKVNTVYYTQFREQNLVFLNLTGVSRNFQIFFASLIKFSIAVVSDVFRNHKQKKEKNREKIIKTKQKNDGTQT